MGKLEDSATSFQEAIEKTSDGKPPEQQAPPVAKTKEQPVLTQEGLTWEKLSTDLGEPIKSVDELKSRFSSLKEATEKIKSYAGIEEKVKTSESTISEYLKKIQEQEELLTKYSDPLSHFGGDAEEYKKLQVKLSLKNSGEQKNVDAAMRLIDGKKISDYDKIKLFEIYNNPTVEESTVDEYLAKKYDIDLTDKDNWDKVTRFQMSKEAAVIDSEMNKLASSIKMPEKIDFSAKKKADETASKNTIEKNKKEWESVKEKLPFDELPFDIDIDVDKNGKKEIQSLKFKYLIPEEDQKALRDIAIKIAVDNNTPYNEEEFKWLMEEVKDRYVKLNRSKIDKAKYDHWRSLWQEEHDKTEHVLGKSNKSDAPGVVDQNDLAAQYQNLSKGLKKGGQ